MNLWQKKLRCFLFNLKNIFLLILLALFSVLIINYSYGENIYQQRDVPCVLLKNMDTLDLDSVMFSTSEWIKGNKDCIYNILDKLADRYIEKNDFKAFSCLTTVCNLATGDIADYLIDINGSFFYAKFGKYTKYLYFYKKNYNEEHCFVNYLIAALSLQVAASDDQPDERQIILNHINSEAKRNHFSKKEKEYVLSIYKRINPDMWKK